MNAPNRERLVALVERLLTGDFKSEEEGDRALAEFERQVPHPGASDLIFHWEGEFASEPTAEEVVDRALSYRPFEL